MFSVAARHHQADQIVAVARRKRRHQQKFGLRFSGQRCYDIGRRNRPGRAALFIGEFRGVPGVGLVVERVRIAHVEQPVNIGLHAENQFRISDVTAQVGGHGRGRLEQIGKQIPISLEQRIVGIEDVEMHGAIVGIHGGFHRIADVVEFADAFETDFGANRDEHRRSCSHR